MRYASREWDGAAGLYYNRARWYDPYLGRFISEDPIGIAGGINLYAYAGNDPVNFFDPSGLDPCRQGDYNCRNPILLPPRSPFWGSALNRYRLSSWLFGFGGLAEGRGPTSIGGGGIAFERWNAENEQNLLDETEELGFWAKVGQVAKEVGQCALEHYGFGDLAARGASWLGAVPIEKRARGLAGRSGC
jgi:RHS repeat-associated protein